jgi:predicted O-linked N-acetylglucosamine transferase (SPINDLY family)
MVTYSDSAFPRSQMPRHYNKQGLTRIAQGRINEAINAFKRAVQQNPDDAEAYFNLALAATAYRDFRAAVKNYEHCLRLNPDHVDAGFNLANTLLQLNNLREAIAAYKNVIRLDPQHAQAFNNLGIAQKKCSRMKEAIQSFHQAIALKKDFAEAYNNLGNAFFKNKQPSRAIHNYEMAVRINPDYAESYRNLGLLYLEIDKASLAISAFQRYLQLQPDDAVILNNLGSAYYGRGQFQRAVSCYRKSLQLAPDAARTYYNLANALQETDKAEKALLLYQKALALNPNWPEAYNNLGNVYKRLGLLSEAAAAFEKTLEMCPGNPKALNNLGIVCRHQGRVEAAISCYRTALQINPEYSECHSNLVFALNYAPGASQADIFAESCRWWERHGRPLERGFVHRNRPDPNRRLKIGYVSADFQRHPVGFFFLPLVRSHDGNNFEVFCYADTRQPDELTDQIRQAAHHWRSTVGVSDTDLSNLIQTDQIDILIDLAGHTANNRLLVFARKPAPLQINWLGYVNTTGLATMDYRITDDIVDPIYGPAHLHSETIIGLKNGFFCFAPPPQCPPIAALPAKNRGYVTFGSFNKLSKINTDVIELWSKILQHVPGSHLRLMARPLADASTQEHFRALFKACGISADRLEMITYTPSYYDYLNQYNQIDIGLDPYPHNGHTTTCDSLWMGVPVITLRGDRYAFRMAASILTRMQLDEFVTDTKAAYFERAVGLAENLGRLQELRLGMRSRFESSPFCDTKGFAGEMESAYREIWRRWCKERKT